MGAKLQDIVRAVIAKAPHWVRQDLSSKDATLRERAEEALAAMIANAVDEAERVG